MTYVEQCMLMTAFLLSVQLFYRVRRRRAEEYRVSQADWWANR